VGVSEVAVSPLPPERFEPLLTDDGRARLRSQGDRARRLLADRTIWNVNSTARGGGVAEMLRSLLAYARGAGIDARWQVISGNDEFFAITKRIHNNLHGAAGDGGPLGESERRVYDATLGRDGGELAALMRPADIAILHDPQTAGLVPLLRRRGHHVIWRCHVGVDLPNQLARRAWDFLRPYVVEADLCVFSREAFEWDGLDRARMVVIPPTIDAFSAKNQELDGTRVDGILRAAGVIDGAAPRPVPFTRQDGSRGTVEHRADMLEESPIGSGITLVTQVSRWDGLKDPVGVLRGFAENVSPSCDAHLMLAGPATAAVSDDPEGAATFRQVVAAWRALADEPRSRVHLASLPMQDGEENAVIVNAVQRRSQIVVQKSLAEGFGLTVAEAMWKARPVVASRIGGIQDQIEDGVTGILLDDPHDLRSFGAAVRRLIDDPARAAAIGEAAQRSVRDRFLEARSLITYVDLLAGLVGSGPQA